MKKKKKESRIDPSKIIIKEPIMIRENQSREYKEEKPFLTLDNFMLAGVIVFVVMAFNLIFTVFSVMTQPIQNVNALGIFGGGTTLGYTLFYIVWLIGVLGIGILSAKNFRN